jgi:hypothetical protein
VTNPMLKRIANEQAIVDDINAILGGHGNAVAVGREDITINDKSVSDLVKREPRLSDSIVDHIWPSVRCARVYHYTSHEAAESILGSGIFRLANIEKRLNDGEIVTFCKTHGLDGYLEKNQQGVPYYRTGLMPQLFYASFTETNLTQEEEEYFWRNFASSDGVRLTFEIEATNPNFRRIVYEPKPNVPIPLLNDLTSILRQKHGREFVLQGISRLCAFYLDGQKYSREKEYRALFKSWPELPPLPVGSGPSSYVEVPLRTTTGGYKFSVTEVHASTRPNVPSCYSFRQR